MKLTSCLSIILGLLVLCSSSYGQNPTPSPTPAVKELKLTMPRLAEELERSEIEPRSKRFKLNLRFLRAKYSRPVHEIEKVPGEQYIWDYYPEASVLVVTYEFGDNYFSLKSEDERTAQVEKLFDALIKPSKLTRVSEREITIGSVSGREYQLSSTTRKIAARTFTRGRFWYVIMVFSKTEDATPLIPKLMNSFEFVDK
jgi:hypothetical protein